MFARRCVPDTIARGLLVGACDDTLDLQLEDGTKLWASLKYVPPVASHRHSTRPRTSSEGNLRLLSLLLDADVDEETGYQSMLGANPVPVVVACHGRDPMDRERVELFHRDSGGPSINQVLSNEGYLFS